MKVEAYWISPKGDILEVPDRHIVLVTLNPKIFGLTLSKIEKTYKKRKEPLFTEGYARDDIMAKLIKSGWIRLRYHPEDDSWTIQATELNARTSKSIEHWGKKTITAEQANKDSGVVISNEQNITFEVCGNYMTLEDIVNGLPSKSQKVR